MLSANKLKRDVISHTSFAFSHDFNAVTTGDSSPSFFAMSASYPVSKDRDRSVCWVLIDRARSIKGRNMLSAAAVETESL